MPRHAHHPLWITVRSTVLLLSTILMAAAGQPALAALLLTEIYYNGPTAGSDPDEFLELSNNSPAQLSLAGYRFTTGINLEFGAGVALLAGQSLVLARDTLGFGASFPAFAGQIVEFGGALSNSGETLSLSNSNGLSLWSVSYDDGGLWPASADGGGSSLQLLSGGGADPGTAGSWFGAAPTPGGWDGFSFENPGISTPGKPTTGSSIPAPSPLALLLPGMALLAGHRALGAVASRRYPAAGG